jgi:hypothetical protein
VADAAQLADVATTAGEDSAEYGGDGGDFRFRSGRSRRKLDDACEKSGEVQVRVSDWRICQQQSTQELQPTVNNDDV